MTIDYTPFIGEIRVFAFEFAPIGWAHCDGQLLEIRSNQALYALIGNKYGGDEMATFALPDLRGHTMLGFSPSLPLGKKVGKISEQLTIEQMPQHNHNGTVRMFKKVGETADRNTAKSGYLAANPNYPTRFATDYDELMPVGDVERPVIDENRLGKDHDNMQPYLVMNFCIALQGMFPSRS